MPPIADDLVECLERGQQALERGDTSEALAAFRAAQELAPTDPSIGLALANAHRVAGDTVAARNTLLLAFRLGPASASVSYQLGAALLDVGAPREAAGCFTRVMRALPNDPAPIAALAGARRTIGDLASGWELITKALAQAPDNPAFVLTAAQIRHELGDLDGAMQWLDKAESIRPRHDPTRLQRAYTSLLRGPSREGWALFESRALPVPPTAARPWHGEPLRGTSVLVTAEQGIGDQFQFLRFLPALTARGAARVIVACHADAVSLLAANGIEAVARGVSPDTDWHVPLLSLPHRLQLDAELATEQVPYLAAPAATANTVAGAMPRRRRFGLVWAGNPAFVGRLTRDFDVALLSDVLAIPDVEWIPLQYGEAGEVAYPSLSRVPLPRDWAGTAELLRGLDGLVSSDTGIVHLAGAMGVRTWVMLQHVPDWRWGMREDSPSWYPSVQRLWQASPGDWGSVVAALRDALDTART